jgi:hypothetical protein
MKKSACVKLVLITGSLAACNRPLYQQTSVAPILAPGYGPTPRDCALAPAYGRRDSVWLRAFREVENDLYQTYDQLGRIRNHTGRVLRAGFGRVSVSISA